MAELGTVTAETGEAAPPPRRPPSGPPRWVRAIGVTGRVLVATGVLILLFLVYQLWGTNLQEAAAQRDLRGRFAATLATATTTVPATTLPATTLPATAGSARPTATGPATTAASASTAATAATGVPTSVALVAGPIHDGDPVARIEIPRIGVDKIVVAGTTLDDLKKGPGLYAGSPLPGQIGNASIAGHRTTFGAPFYRVNELAAGDEIKVTTIHGVFVYRVTRQRVVDPTDVSVIAATPDAELTLTSCHPRFSANERIVISARLDPAASATAGQPPVTSTAVTSTAVTSTGVTSTALSPNSAAATSVPPTSGTAATGGSGDDPAVVGPVPPGAPRADAFTTGWFGDPAAWPQVALWGTALTLVALGAWRLGRRRPQWVAAAAGLGPFLVLLYFFYENVARLLPPNL